MKVHITTTNKKTNKVIHKRMAMVVQGDAFDLNNLIKELKEIKNTINGFLNQDGLALKDVHVEIEINNTATSFSF